jgi:hypothetical protein
MKLRSYGVRALILTALIVGLLLPAFAAAIERVCLINAVVVNPKIPKYKVYAPAGLEGDEAKGTLSIGPPAWDDKTEYFTGDLTDVERIEKGVRLAATGTFGTRIVSTRKASSAFVEVVDGKVSVSGLPHDYCVTLAKTESGRITIYPAATGTAKQ